MYKPGSVFGLIFTFFSILISSLFAYLLQYFTSLIFLKLLYYLSCILFLLILNPRKYYWVGILIYIFTYFSHLISLYFHVSLLNYFLLYKIFSSTKQTKKAKTKQQNTTTHNNNKKPWWVGTLNPNFDLTTNIYVISTMYNLTVLYYLLNFKIYEYLSFLCNVLVY